MAAMFNLDCVSHLCVRIFMDGKIRIGIQSDNHKDRWFLRCARNLQQESLMASIMCLQVDTYVIMTMDAHADLNIISQRLIKLFFYLRTPSSQMAVWSSTSSQNVNIKELVILVSSPI